MQPKAKLWIGRVLSGLAVFFFLMDAVMKFVKPEQVVEATTKLGYTVDVITPLGVVLLVCTILYAIPRTTVLGAILLTGYLGGAVASHLRAGDPLFSHVLAPAYFGVMVWGGLYLRSERVRAAVCGGVCTREQNTASRPAAAA